MATTKRQQQIQASLDEVQLLLSDVSVASAAKEDDSKKEEIKKAKGDGRLEILKYLKNAEGKVPVRVLKKKFSKNPWFNAWLEKKKPDDNFLFGEAEVVGKGLGFLKEFVESDADVLDFFGSKLAQKAGDWIESKLPKSIKDYLDYMGDEDEDENEDKNEDEDEEIKLSQEDIVETSDSDPEVQIEYKSKSLDETIKKFKNEPGPKHIDDLVKVLTEYTEAAKKLEEENKKKAEQLASDQRVISEREAAKKNKEEDFKSRLSQQFD